MNLSLWWISEMIFKILISLIKEQGDFATLFQFLKLYV